MFNNNNKVAFNLLIAGGREFVDYFKLKEAVHSSLRELQVRAPITIISGGARGADKLGETYAETHGHRCAVYPADWDKLGKSAGYIRNATMGEVADAAVIFWDGSSRGTKNMISVMKRLGKPVHVYNYEGVINNDPLD